MINQQDILWQELTEIWNKSKRLECIKLQYKDLFTEFESKVSEFEKNSIKKDLQFIEQNTTAFEKRLIQRDLNLMKKAVHKFLSLFKKNK